MKYKFPILFLIAISFFCCSFSKDNYKNFILITADALRQDYLGCYGNKNISTPFIDDLAKEGIIFKNAFTPMPITLPSHSSMLYSRYPWELNIFTNNDVLTDATNSLQKSFKLHGFQTAAFTSLGVLNPFFGLSKNFDYYFNIPRKFKRSYLFADELNKEILTWLDKHYQLPFFIWIHYSDTHEPYVPKNALPDIQVEFNQSFLGKFTIQLKEINSIRLKLRKGKNFLKFIGIKNINFPQKIVRYRLQLKTEEENIELIPKGNFQKKNDEFIFTKEIIFELMSNNKDEIILNFTGGAEQSPLEIKQNYALEVENIDRAIGEVLSWLKSKKLYEKTLIIFLADHGEALGEKGMTGHESQLYLTQIRIPFIIKDGINKGKIVKYNVSTIDIAPTVMSYFRLPINKNWQGENLINLMHRQKNNEKRIIKSAAIYYASKEKKYLKTKFSIIKGNKHLIYSPDNDRYELYILGEDLREGKNLFNEIEEPSKLELIKGMKLFSHSVMNLLLNHKTKLLPEEIQEHLRALGYL